jgi:hypothetical protein
MIVFICYHFLANLRRLQVDMFDTAPFISVTDMNPALSITNNSWITELAFSIVYNALIISLVSIYAENQPSGRGNTHCV